MFRSYVSENDLWKAIRLCSTPIRPTVASPSVVILAFAADANGNIFLITNNSGLSINKWLICYRELVKFQLMLSFLLRLLRNRYSIAISLNSHFQSADGLLVKKFSRKINTLN